MERYRNLGGDSGVRAYALRDDSIVVEFQDGSRYVYDHRTTGRAEVEQMKRLAILGKGLTAYINKHVRDRFAAKL
jgi:hypothetical protein